MLDRPSARPRARHRGAHRDRSSTASPAAGCARTAAPTTTSTNRPKVDWTCDVCGGEVVQRDDDTEEAVASRLEVYERQTVPIIDFYEKLGKLVVVDGVGDGDEVQERLVKEIDGRFRRPADVDHPQERRADRARCAGRARWWRRCTRCASAAAVPGATHARRRRGGPRGASTDAGRPLQLPRLPRVPRGGLHVAQRRDRARHPERRRRARRRATSSRSTAGRSSRAGTPTPRSRSRSARSTTSRQRLIEVTRRSLEAAIDQVVEGNRLGDVGAAVEGIAEAAGFTVVREYVGHGIGTAMHEDPQVPNYGPAGRGMRLKEGHVLAIEPMVNAGGRRDRGARRRLDRRHPRRPPLRPLRAHHRRHRPRPRGPDPPR